MSQAYNYQVVIGSDEVLKREVSDLTRDGWEIHGNLVFVQTGSDYIFAQAMVKAASLYPYSGPR